MDNYIVSARKYRPDTFATVVGQHALTTTLQNAIATGKLAHAYLFCGPRGVGKTTCARIFAKTINCLHPTPQGEACNECESCQAFNQQRSFNIHELDAASNNSVEDIRSLIEQVRIPPQIGKYKVFIIDEVHMLSPAAFNAFLKTLEEPPAHAIFILATTEKHKILPTILSRCQIYDFNRMEVSDMVDHLKKVADNEHITYEEDALNIIAQKADGGMRDALSIFDQVSSFTGGNITYQKVIEDLNVLDYEYYFKLTDLVLQTKISDILLTFNDILEKGFEAQQFVGGLAAHFRNLLVCRDTATLPLLEVANTVKERYREQATRCKAKFLFKALKLCNTCDMNYRTSRNKRLLVEIMLIEVAQAAVGDDESSGLRPTQLAPIFTKGAASEAAVAPQQPQVHPAPGTLAAAPTATTTHVVTEPHTPYTPSPAPQVTKEKKPLKILGTISIRPGATPTAPTDGQAKTTEQASAPSPTARYGEEPVRAEAIMLPWLRFANALPQEEKAISARMLNMKLQLNNAHEIVVEVENSQVQKDLTAIKNRIEHALRTDLKNGNVFLTIKLADLKNAPRAYTKREQFEVLLKKHPQLTQFANDLDLELA